MRPALRELPYGEASGSGMRPTDWATNKNLYIYEKLEEIDKENKLHRKIQYRIMGTIITITSLCLIVSAIIVAGH